MKTVIEMAREADLIDDTSASDWYVYQLERFAELVRADAIAEERKANIGCIGRIAAMVVDPIDQARLYEAMDAIRSRSSEH